MPHPEKEDPKKDSKKEDKETVQIPPLVTHPDHDRSRPNLTWKEVYDKFPFTKCMQ